jgi:hypothetical protein
MKLSFDGRIRNVSLPYTHALMPLFEAVINSIHAIEDARITDGKIRVDVKRDMGSSDTFSTIRASGDIVGFVIEDNGTGFTEPNYLSFETSDSMFKQDRGAKGVGRFMWLKAFDDVQIESVYSDGKSCFHRTFGFDLTHGGTYDLAVTPHAPQASYTRVALRGFKARYVEETPKRTETMADRIVEHCLFYLLDSRCPIIELNDSGAGETINVNEHFRRIVHDNVVCSNMKVGNDTFTVQHVHLYSTDSMFHEVHFCGNRRDVLQYRLNNRIPELRQKIKGTDGKHFTYYAYVSGPALDAVVNTERAGFNLPQEGEIGMNGELTVEGILTAVVTDARRHLAASIAEVQAGVKQRVVTLVATKYPEHRHVLKYVDTYAEEFTPAMKDDDLALKLNEIQFREDIKTRVEAQAIVENGPTDDEAYKKQLKHYLDRMSEFRESRLAQYVIHRKCILEILRKRLEVRSDGKHEREEQIHEVIFPLKKSSDDIEWNRQNLWVIDERLAYHHYLASDKPFCAIQTDSDNRDRADIIVYDNPSAFSDAENGVQSHVTLIEFKRPERDKYGAVRDYPTEQVFRYIRAIQSGEVKTVHGRTIRVHPGTQYNCHIVCDLSKPLIAFLDDNNYASTPDREAFYAYNDKLKAYVEIVSFNRLLTASENRNRVLFKSLGLLD